MIDKRLLNRVKIKSIEPSMDEKVFEVNFTIGEEWFQFMYYPNNLPECWFSDLPEEFEDYDEDEIRKAFIELINIYELKKSINPSTAKQFEELIDEL
jgi:hypothetical protein